MKTLVLVAHPNLDISRVNKAWLEEKLDDVLTYGWGYTSKGGKLRGKELGLAISIGGSEIDYQPGGGDLYSIPELLSPFNATSNLMETELLTPFTIFDTDDKTEEELVSSARKCRVSAC